MSTCPSDETLARLGHDSPDGAEWSAVEAHVQRCEKCVGSLEKLLSHDTATAPEPASALLPAEENLPHIPDFEIDGELGRGGMGVVYRAWEPRLARMVALKIVPSGPMTGSRERKRWLAEARCVTRVSHPNIVQIHEAGEADGWLYLVLEFVPGGSLKERLSGPVPPRAAAELMRPVAAAMTAVHAAGLLHLDLKPSNILLDSPHDAPWQSAAPKVADFGIARSLADRDASATSLAGPWGTPSYMAPEQATAARADVGAAADIHALGAILYELLTGRPPFQGTSALETLDQVRGQKPVPPRRLNLKIPRDLETVSLKCLEKNPARRYVSAEALADDLNRFLDGRPIKARPVSPIEHAWRRCRRQPVITALAATMLLTMIGSFVGLLVLLRRSEAQRSSSEANYQVASRSLDELLKIFSEDAYSNRVNIVMYLRNVQRWKAIEIARTQEIELSKRYPLDIPGLRRLAVIDECLSGFCDLNGKPDEARSLREESIGCWEACLALNPRDVEIRQQLLGAIEKLLPYLIDSKDEHSYERWNARAIAMLKGLKSPYTNHAGAALELSRQHRFRANSLMAHGESDRARKELEDDLNLVRSESVAGTASPAFVLSETLALAALGQWSGEFVLPLSPIQSQPTNVEINDLEPGLAELTARRIGWLPSIVKSSWLIPEELPIDAWVDRIISSIKSDATAFNLDHTRIPAIAWTMREPCYSKLAWQRMFGKLGDALRGADQLLALAERLTQSYPDQAAAYMLLSEGYVQRAKNGYRVDDEPVIEWERKALEAAIHAETLAPDNDEARGLVNDRRARLHKLASK